MQIVEANSVQVFTVNLRDTETEIRALLNDQTHIAVLTSDKLRPFIKLAVDRVPFLAAALVALSRQGDTDSVRLLMQWGIPATTVALPSKVKVTRRKKKARRK